MLKRIQDNIHANKFGVQKQVKISKNTLESHIHKKIRKGFPLKCSNQQFIDALLLVWEIFPISKLGYLL